MKYDLEYFIGKFEAIPEDKWTTGNYVDKDDPECMCAYGHLGERRNSRSIESDELDNITKKYGVRFISQINDDTRNINGFGQTPKQRVVNYLKYLKNKPNEKHTTNTTYPYSNCNKLQKGRSTSTR